MGNVALIIPIRDQVKYWNRLRTSIENMTQKPDILYLMLDRATMQEEMVIRKNLIDGLDVRIHRMTDIPEYMGNPNMTSGSDPFLAGHRRNQAIDIAIADGCDVFIFIDGDCMPGKNLISGHVAVNRMGVPNAAVARRLEESYGWKDQRELDPFRYGDTFFPDKGEFAVFNNVRSITTSSVVWTCNFSINIDAVNIIREINQKYYGRYELFNSEFSGSWGGEDGFLGYQCIVGGIRVVSIGDPLCSVRHIDHPRPPIKYDPMLFNGIFRDEMHLFSDKVSHNPMLVQV